MDDGEKERAVSDSLKEIVRYTSRRKSSNQRPNASITPVRLAPKQPDGLLGQLSTTRGTNSDEEDTNPERECAVSQDENLPVREDGSLCPPLACLSKQTDISEIALPFRHIHSPTTVTAPRISAEDSVLLMHYLDYVFSLQYPMYKPESPTGRGWLLPLLLYNESLYHGALALSAYHCRTINLERLSQSRQLAMQVQQEQHLEISIKVAHQAAQTSCPKSGLGIAMAVVQLSFYEVLCLRAVQQLS